jgi:hypothetical protein
MTGQKLIKRIRALVLTLFLIPAILIAETPEQVDFLIGGLTNSSGQPLNGGKVYSYTAGTTSNKTTYQDIAKTTPHANPIVLDSQGKKLVFADGSYKFRIDNSSDVTQYTLDNLKFGMYGGPATYAGPTTGSSNAYVATLSPALLALDNGALITFTANHTNTGSATLNVNGLGAKPLYSAEATNFTTSQILSGHTYSFVYSTAQVAWLAVESYGDTGWVTYTPTITPAGAMTYTSSSITYAKYKRIAGNLAFAQISFTGTVGGTPNAYFGVTLPSGVAASNAGISAAVTLLDNSLTTGGVVTYPSSTAINIYRYNGGNFTAGTVTVTINIFYQT